MKTVETTETTVTNSNPFYRAVTESRCAQWIIENRSAVSNKVAKQLMTYGYSTRYVNDLYDHMVNYFIEHPEKDFDDSYFGHDEDYKIKSYVFSRMNYEIMTFCNKLKQQPSEVYIHDTDEEGSFAPYTISGDLASFNKQVEDSLMASIEMVVEFDDYKSIYEIGLTAYQEEFKNVYNGFDIRKFIRAVFLSSSQADYNAIGDMLDLTIGEVDRALKRFKDVIKKETKRCEEERNKIEIRITEIRALQGQARNGAVDIDVKALQTEMKALDIKYAKFDKPFKHLFEDISTLMKGMEKGWMPV